MKKLIFSALIGAMIISCSRDNNSIEDVIAQVQEQQSAIFPKKITYFHPNEGTSSATLVYDGDKLKEIIDNEGNKTEVTYTGDLITSFKEKGRNVNLEYANGELKSESVKIYSQDNVTLQEEQDYAYSYSGSQVTAQVKKRYYNEQGVMTLENEYTYAYELDSEKRPVKIVKTQVNTAYISTEVFVYANHNNPFKNIKGINKLYYSHLMLEEGLNLNLDLSTKVLSHNQSNNTSEYKYIYEVNANNYPIKQKISHKDETTGGNFIDEGDLPQ